MPEMDLTAVHLEALDRGEAQLASVLAVMAKAGAEGNDAAAVAMLAECKEQPQ